jgi:hypothetical protein
MKPTKGRVAGSDKVWAIAKPLQASFPDVSMNIIVGAGWYAKKLNLQHSSKNQPDDNNTSGESWRS